MWVRLVPVKGTVLCIVGRLAASLASTHLMPAAPCPHPVTTINSISSLPSVPCGPLRATVLVVTAGFTGDDVSSSTLAGRKDQRSYNNEISYPRCRGLAAVEWFRALIRSQTDSYPGFPTYKLHGLGQITDLYFSSLICKVGAIIVPTQ